MATGIERPIELQPGRVRALMAERRAVLELPMTPVPHLLPEHFEALRLELGGLFGVAPGFDDVDTLDLAFRDGLLPQMRCPYGRGGDVLWFREPWAQVGRGFRHRGRDAVAGDDLVWLPASSMPRQAARVVMKIDDVGVSRPAGVWCWRVEVERVVVFSAEGGGLR